MTLLQSVLLGIVQGITEFLPVSSSGHLSILQNVFHIDAGSSSMYNILLHLATVAVVVVFYRKDIIRLIGALGGIIRDLFANLKIRKHNRTSQEKKPLRCIICNNYRKFLILLIVSTIPTGVIGIAARKLTEDASRALIIPGICLLATAALLFLSDRLDPVNKIPRDITWKEALIIGIAQGFAVLPGLSRSGATIAACLLCGFGRLFAVKYSFILSLPAILGAALLELKDIPLELADPYQLLICAAGMAAAAIVGWFCIRTMLAVVKSRKFKYFALYCLAAGIFAIVGQFIFM